MSSSFREVSISIPCGHQIGPQSRDPRPEDGLQAAYLPEGGHLAVERERGEFCTVVVVGNQAVEQAAARVGLLEMSDAEWREVLRVNLDGSFFVTRDVGRVMAAQKSGTMILMTSDRGGTTSTPTLQPYSAGSAARCSG